MSLSLHDSNIEKHYKTQRTYLTRRTLHVPDNKGVSIEDPWSTFIRLTLNDGFRSTTTSTWDHDVPFR